MAKVSNIVRGLGIANKFLLTLTNEIRLRGGSDQILHTLTTPDHEHQIGRLADLLVSYRWREPVKLSELKKLARKLSEEDNEEESSYPDNDELFFWSPALRKLEIPFLRLYTDEDSEFGAEHVFPLTREVAAQLDGKPAAPGMPVKWNEHHYVVVDISYQDRACGPDLDEIIDSRKVESICISLDHHFDMFN